MQQHKFWNSKVDLGYLGYKTAAKVLFSRLLVILYDVKKTVTIIFIILHDFSKVIILWID